MKNIRKARSFTAFGIILTLIFSACHFPPSDINEPSKLSAPEHLQITDDILSWNTVAHAVYYAVNIDGTDHNADTPQYSLADLSITKQAYQIKIKAIGDETNYLTSDWSETITYTPDTENTGESKDPGLRPALIDALHFNLIENETAYEVSVGTAIKYDYTDIIIPDAYNQKPVTKIADRGFCDDYAGNNYAETDKLKSIIIPRSVTAIGAQAFSGCASLKNIDIPENVTEIGSGAFFGCVACTNVKIPAKVERIGSRAFDNDSPVVIYAAATEKPEDWDNDWNMTGCPVYFGINESNLIESDGAQYVIQKGYAVLTRYVGTSGLFGVPPSIIIGTRTYDVSAIGDCAFLRSNAIRSIDISENITAIGQSAFSFCAFLVNVKVGYKVTHIGPFAFNRCVSLTHVEVERGSQLTGIGESAFYDCKLLVRIIFYDNDLLEHIGRRAFSGCVRLTSIAIPKSVMRIDLDAFAHCESLMIYADINESEVPDGWAEQWNDSLPVYFGVDCTEIIEVDGAQYIGDGDGVMLTKYFGDAAVFVFPSSINHDGSLYKVTGVGSYAFCGQTSLRCVIFNHGSAYVGKDAFTAAGVVVYSNLSSAPAGWHAEWHAADIPVYWDANDAAFTTVDDAQYIVQDGQAGLTRYTGISADFSVPDSIYINETAYPVTEIKKMAFYNHNSLTRIRISSGVKRIGDSAFRHCGALSEVKFAGESSLEGIGNGGFSDCGMLTHIILPPGVIEIGDYAFSGCKSLSSILLSEAITKMGFGTFADGESLTVYAETERNNGYGPNSWGTNWNPSGCVVIFDCTVSPDKTYVVSIKKLADDIADLPDADAESRISAPYRDGYVFQEWNVSADGTGTVCSLTDMTQYRTLPDGMTLYAIWVKT